MSELPSSTEQHVCHLVVDHRPSQGHKAIGYRFRKRYQVGLHAVGLTAKPATGATKSTNYFVRDKEDVALVKNTLYLWPIGFGRNNDPTCTLHRFGNKGGHILFTQFVNLGFELSGSLNTKTGFVEITATFKP